MLGTTTQDKAMMERLSRATGMPHAEDIKKGAPPNPFAAVHWLLENDGPQPKKESGLRSYIVSIMRNGLILARQPIGAGECTKQEEMNALVAALFAKIPDEKKAA